MRVNLKSTRFRVVTAYILLVLLPSLAFILLLTSQYERRVVEEWETGIEERLTSLEQEISASLLDANRMLMDVQQDEIFSPHRLKKNYYHVMKAVQQLHRYRASNNMAAELVYFDPGTDLLFTGESTMSRKVLLPELFVMDPQGPEMFWEAVEATGNTFISTPQWIAPSLTGKGRVLVYTVNMDKTSRPSAPKLLVLAETAQTEIQMRSFLPVEAASILVTDATGNTLYAAGEFPALLLPEGEGEPRMTPERLRQLEENSDYVVATHTSMSGWQYYMCVPVWAMLQQIRVTTKLFVLFAATLLVASLLFLAVCFRYNFLPLRRIVQAVRFQYDGTDSNEFDLFYHGYQALSSSNQSMQRQLDASYPVRRSHFLNQALLGAVDGKEFRKAQRELELGLERKYFCVVVVHNARQETDWDLASMEAAAQEYLQERKLGHCIEQGGGDWAVIILNLSQRDQEMCLLEVARMQEVIQERTGYVTMACLGGIQEGPAGIRLSCQEAFHASRYRYLSVSNQRISYADTGGESPFTQEYPSKTLSRLRDLLRSGSPEQIQEEMEQLRLGMKGKSLMHCRGVYCDAAYSVLHHIHGKHQEALIGAAVLEDVGEALESRSIDQMNRLMLRLEQQLTELGKAEEERLEERAKKYIQEHYTDPGFSIQEVAAELGVSAGHLSRSYKRETGQTLLNTVNQLRIEHAKHLLADTELSFSSIVQEIGYIDVSSFHRKFKAVVQETPGAYRERNRKTTGDK